jgi:formate dehydrogenase iron-sulfur subunit
MPKDVRKSAEAVAVETERGDGAFPRRRFLQVATTAVGTAGVLAASGPARAEGLAPISDPEVLAREHADDPALLIDLTRCVGCGRCVRACKAANGLEWRDDQPALGPDAALASSNWSVVRPVTVEVEEPSALGPRRRPERRYVRLQCMHCLEPACASACFVKALQKSEAGPVVYDPNRCVGCRYCMMACPFGVPTFEWDETFGRIQKCDFCVERTSRGLPTACAEACPEGAITFGRRAALLAEAWRQIGSDARYVRHVYGEREVGGTSVLYLSDVPFEELGLPTELPTDPLPTYTWEVSRLLPPIAGGFMTTIMALWARRQRILRAREAETAGPEAPGGHPEREEEVHVR